MTLRVRLSHGLLAAMLLLLLAVQPGAAVGQPLVGPDAVSGLPPTVEDLYQGACVPRPRVDVKSEKIGERDFRITVTAGRGNLELLRFSNAPTARVDLPGQPPDRVPPFEYKPPAAPTIVFTVGSSNVATPFTLPITIYDGCGQNQPWNTFVGSGQSGTQVQVSIADASVVEGDVGTSSANFVVSLSSPASVPVTVAWTTEATASALSPQDFVANQGVLTFTPGQTQQTIPVQVVNDTIDEPNKTFNVKLTNATNAIIIDGTATGTIVDNEGAPSLSINDITFAEGGTGNTTPFQFTVSLTSPSGQPVSVKYATANETAVAGIDYTGIPLTTLNFIPGETQKTVIVQITGDAVFEPNERFFIGLEQATNATISKNQGFGTIANDDAPPSVNVSFAPTSFAELNSGTTNVTATLTGPSYQDVTVDVQFGGSATPPPGANHDFTFTGPAKITVPAGQLTGALTLTAVNDIVFEGNEEVQATISNPVNASLGATTTATAQLTENDTAPTVSLSLSSPTFTENNNGTTNVVATLTGAVDELVTVTVTLGGGSSTASNTDYRVGPTPPAPATAQILIQPFTTTGSITLTGVDDLTTEGDETVVVAIQTVTGGGVTAGAPSQVTATINDDDAPKVTLSFDPATPTSFGENGGTIVVRATLDVTPPVGKDAVITLAFTGGTAVLNTDFSVSNSGQITITNGSTSDTVTLTGINDDIDEVPDEIVNITIGSLVNAADPAPAETLQATITDADDPPSITLTLDPSNPTPTQGTFAENGGTIAVVATANRLSTQAITVNLDFLNTSTATHPPGSGFDYSRNLDTTTIVIPALTLTGQKTLTGVQDLTSEGNETVIIDIGSVTNGTENGAQQVTATIVDDDLPTVTLSLIPASPAEFNEDGGGNTIQVQANLSNSNWPDPVTVNLTYSGTATRRVDGTTVRPDFDGALQIIVPANSASAAITLTAITDTIFEGDESVIVDIDTVSGGAEGTPNQVTATLKDNDLQPSATLTVNDTTIAEAAGEAIVTISLSNPTTQAVTVTLQYTGSASNPADYTRTIPDITISFAAFETSKTVTLTAVQDTVYENGGTNEQIIVDIATPLSNVTEGTPNQVTVEIVEDDPPPTVRLFIVGTSDGTATTSIAETGGEAVIQARLSSSVATDTTVTLTINASGTATDPGAGGVNDPVDYSRTPSGSPIQLTIPAGLLSSSTSASPSLTLSATSDTLDEENETIVVDIDSVTGGITEGTPNSVTVTITDDDVEPTVSWTVASQGPVVEGTAGTLTVTAQLSAPSGKTVTVPYTLGGDAQGSGIDYTILSNPSPLVFDPGVGATPAETQQSVSVQIANDTTAEDPPTETITLTISSAAPPTGPTNATVGSTPVHTITIQDDDVDAVDDSYTATGGVPIDIPAATGVINNDVPDSMTVTDYGWPLGTEATALNTAVATEHGGLVTIQSNGSFYYEPPCVVSGGTDRFKYQASNGVNSDIATVSITIQNQACFVGANATGTEIGSVLHPFTDLADVPSTRGNTGLVYVFTGTLNSTSGITLKTGEVLEGQGVGLRSGATVITANLPFSLAADSDVDSLPEASTAPTLNTTTGSLVTLGSGNTLKGFTAGNTPATAITGSSFGTLNISSTAINTNGRALNLVTGTVNGSLSSTTSTGGANNVTLNAVGTSGTFDLGTGALSAATSDAFSVTGGGGTVTYGGTINNTTARLLSVTSTTGGAISLTNATAGGLANSGTGILISGADGSVTVGGSGPAGTVNLTGSKGIEILGTNANTATGTFTFNHVTIDTANGATNHAVIVDGDQGTPADNGVNATIDLNDVDITNPGGLVATIRGIRGGSVDFDSASLITRNDDGLGVLVTSNTGGTVSFGQSTKTLDTAGNAAVTLDTNPGVTINFPNGGLDIDTTTAGAFIATGGGTVNVTGSTNSLTTTTGAALNVANTTVGASGLTFQSASTNGAVTGILLDTIGAGNVTINGGSIVDATGRGVDINSGTGNFTYAGTIDTNGSVGTPGSGRSVEVTGHTGGTVAFSGAITDTGIGVNLTGNTGAAINFTGGVAINTGASTGFNATGGGTIAVRGTGNTIASTSATALNVTTTIADPQGGSETGLRFQSISSGNSTAAADPANGIVLNGTGASGSLTVTGNGGTCSSVGNCTGGAIQTTTSHGISLTSTLSPSFTRIAVQGTSGSGIEGTGVTNFTLQNSFIDTSGTGGGADDSNIAFNNQAAGTENNISGTVTITNNTLTNARWHGIMLQNFNGTIADAVITGNTITSSTSIASSLGYGINLQILGSATTVSNLTKATISGNTVHNFPSAGGIQVQGGNSNAAGPAGIIGTAGHATNIISIVDNLVRGQSPANPMATSAILFTVTGKGQGNVDISSNGTNDDPLGNNIGTTIGVGANGNTTLTAFTNNNFVESNHPGDGGDSGISGGVGVAFGVTDVATMFWTINGNQIRNVDGNGILAVARGTNGTLNVTIKNNNVEAPEGGVRPGIRVDAGNTTASTDNDVCLDIASNTSAGSGGHQGIGLRKQGTSATVHAFGIEGMSATSTPGVEAFVDGQNPAGNGTLLISATSGFTNCSTAP